MELHLLVAKPNTTQNQYIDKGTPAPMAGIMHGPIGSGNKTRYRPHVARK